MPDHLQTSRPDGIRHLLYRSIIVSGELLQFALWARVPARLGTGGRANAGDPQRDHRIAKGCRLPGRERQLQLGIKQPPSTDQLHQLPIRQRMSWTEASRAGAQARKRQRITTLPVALAQ